MIYSGSGEPMAKVHVSPGIERAVNYVSGYGTWLLLDGSASLGNKAAEGKH